MHKIFKKLGIYKLTRICSLLLLCLGTCNTLVSWQLMRDFLRHFDHCPSIYTSPVAVIKHVSPTFMAEGNDVTVNVRGADATDSNGQMKKCLLLVKKYIANSLNNIFGRKMLFLCTPYKCTIFFFKICIHIEHINKRCFFYSFFLIAKRN